MFETPTNERTRDAIRAAHAERGRVFREGLRMIFGARYMR